jgi:Rad3-related DNA helicase
LRLPSDEIQKRFMRVLFEVIEHQKVGIFESPTGTVSQPK